MRDGTRYPSRLAVLSMAVLALFVRAVPMTASAVSSNQLSARSVELKNAWMSTEDVYWLDATTIGLVAARRGADGPAYTFLRIAGDGTQSELLQLHDQSHCRLSDGSFLFRALSDTAPDPVVVTWPTPGVASQQALSDCLGATSLAFSRNEARFEQLDSLASDGTHWVGILGRGEAGAELVLFTETEIIGQWPVGLELWKDNMVIAPLPDGTGFLVYPSFTAARREALRDSTDGIPTWRISPGAEPVRIDIPWADWNSNGLYRFVPTDSGMIAALVTGYGNAGAASGLYHEATGWRQIRQADVLPDTLRVSPDGCRILWLERGDGAETAPPGLMMADACTF